MHFEAETNGIKYEVNVTEGRRNWKVSIKPENKTWCHYDILKSNYQSLDSSISFLYENSSFLIDVVGKSSTDYTVYTRGSHRTINIFNDESLLHESLKTAGQTSNDSQLSSGMPGKITKIYVKPGDEIKQDEPLLIMEAMKMENEMRAPRDVKIKDIKVKEGQNVESGTELVTYE